MKDSGWLGAHAPSCFHDASTTYVGALVVVVVVQRAIDDVLRLLVGDGSKVTVITQVVTSGFQYVTCT